MTLLSVEQALQKVLTATPLLGTETLGIAEAFGRVVSEPVLATRTLPPWANASMDGFAIASSTQGPFVISQTVHAGGQPAPLAAGTSARIMTGAPLPRGADTVLEHEKTRLEEDGRVSFLAPSPSGNNVRPAGEDIRAGAVLLRAGDRIGLAEAAALFSQGETAVSVFKLPRVAIACSGDELVEAGQPCGPQQLIDCNGPTLAMAVRLTPALPTLLPLAPDDLGRIADNVERGLGFDVLLCVAGVSVGAKDYTLEALSRCGVTLDFWRVAIKPGKPLALGRHGHTLVFGLPGNPISALTTFELFVRPALMAMQGVAPTVERARARLGKPLRKPRGLRQFIRATVEERNAVEWATPLVNQSSGALSSGVGATHLIELPEDCEELAEGTEITVRRLGWRPK